MAWGSWLIDEGYRGEMECIIAKIFGSEAMKEAAIELFMKTHGGRSFLKGHLFGDNVYDFLAPCIYEGEGEVLGMAFFKSLVKEHGKQVLRADRQEPTTLLAADPNLPAPSNLNLLDLALGPPGRCPLSVIDVTFSFRIGRGFARPSCASIPLGLQPLSCPLPALRLSRRWTASLPSGHGFFTLPGNQQRQGLFAPCPWPRRPLVSLCLSTAPGTRNARAHADPGRQASPRTRHYTPQPPRSSVGRCRDLGRRWPSDPSHDGRRGRARVGPAVTPPSSGGGCRCFPGGRYFAVRGVVPET